MGASIKLKLTNRDQQLIDVLKSVRCLGHRQVEQLLHLRGKAYDNRLRCLRRTGYLRKLTYGHLGGVYGVVWTGGPKFRGEIKPFSCTRLPEINHQLGLSQIYVDLFLKESRLRQLINWQDGYGNIVQLGGNRNLLPDAIITLRQSDGGVIYLELDRSTKDLGRIELQLKQYRDYLLSPYAKNNEQVWFVTKTRERCKSFQELCSHLSIDTMAARKVRITEMSVVVNDFATVIGLRDQQLQAQNHRNVEPANDELIPKSAVKQFIEEAVGMYHEQRLRLPASYKAAADAIYSK